MLLIKDQFPTRSKPWFTSSHRHTSPPQDTPTLSWVLTALRSSLTSTGKRLLLQTTLTLTKRRIRLKKAIVLIKFRSLTLLIYNNSTYTFPRQSAPLIFNNLSSVNWVNNKYIRKTTQICHPWTLQINSKVNRRALAKRTRLGIENKKVTTKPREIKVRNILSSLRYQQPLVGQVPPKNNQLSTDKKCAMRPKNLKKLPTKFKRTSLWII